MSVFPGSAVAVCTRISATIHLMRADTGKAIAAVMDGRIITAWRTAAVSAIATRVLASEGARVLAILGSGVQARWHLDALKLVQKVEEIRIWNPPAETCEAIRCRNRGHLYER